MYYIKINPPTQGAVAFPSDFAKQAFLKAHDFSRKQPLTLRKYLGLRKLPSREAREAIFRLFVTTPKGLVKHPRRGKIVLAGKNVCCAVLLGNSTSPKRLFCGMATLLWRWLRSRKTRYARHGTRKDPIKRKPLDLLGQGVFAGVGV